MVIDFSTLYDFPKEMEKLFDDVARFQGTGGLGFRRPAYPLINIAEDDHNYYVEISVPGIPPKDVELTMTDRSLVIKGERKGTEGRYLRRERGMGSFQRIITLNVPVDRDKVTAAGSDGVMRVTLPKADSVKPRRITVTGAESKAIDV
ncbi:Hsp20/alpha crystallin family protein [Desulfovibrio psychrotolerans]|uniref:Molecular chaperone Hsp20 n=1 Tax=Desulfovibrio psychrotolerans TaxID=415242 RepID=A0A7J0BUF8_9BACT|nr:Hsp20/alpha crystallin family protein [Desulfovibrio psychrotolerans]GFM36634.1 molecular chaperone Hsp20 [Desulfovibrio psychrotolerans]